MTGEWVRLASNHGTHPDPAICLYAAAMALRGEADGSAEGCTTCAECVAIRDYLLRRLSNWRPARSESEQHLHAFLRACVREAEAGAPYLFQNAVAHVGTSLGTYCGIRAGLIDSEHLKSYDLCSLPAELGDEWCPICVAEMTGPTNTPRRSP